MPSDLRKGKCRTCEGGLDKMTGEAIASRLSELSGWIMQGNGLIRDFHFRNFYETMAFVNAVAWIADREDHHPDMEVGYAHCLLRYSTHALGGITENDFVCAAQVNRLLE